MMFHRRKNTASRLKRRLTLQQEIRTDDGQGGYTRSWKDVASLWAEIMPVKGVEQLAAGKLESPVTHKIMLRYRDGITAGQRLCFEGRAFNIHAVLNTQESDEILQVLAEEGAAG